MRSVGRDSFHANGATLRSLGTGGRGRLPPGGRGAGSPKKCLCTVRRGVLNYLFAYEIFYLARKEIRSLFEKRKWH